MMGFVSYALVGGLALIASLAIAAIDRRLLSSRKERHDD